MSFSYHNDDMQKKRRKKETKIQIIPLEVNRRKNIGSNEARTQDNWVSKISI